MTVKERLQQVVSEMTEDEAADALALVAGARAGATPTDIYGTAWGKVLADLDPEALNNTNRMRLYVFGSPDGSQARLVAQLDNLGKGASGAAVQNLNLMLGLEESAGL